MQKSVGIALTVMALLLLANFAFAACTAGTGQTIDPNKKVACSCCCCNCCK
jgi:hypothetical protein